MVGRDHRGALYFSWSFYYPVGQLFLFEAAGVADKFSLFHFAEFIFARSYSQHFGTSEPQRNFSTTLIAIAVRIGRIGEPYPLFEAESFIGEGSHGADIYHITGKIIVDRIGNVGADLGYIPAV